MSEPICSIIEAMDDPQLFARWFKRPETWRAWRVFLKALFALPMTDDELVVYRQCTGRETPPTARVEEAWLVAGRRGGKSLILALIGVFLAAFVDWTPYLVPGELALISIIAADRRQSRAIMRYSRAMFTHIPMLAALLDGVTDDEIVLKNGISIEITTASFRTVRGATLVAALLDEIAFWRTGDSANPDYEILAALRPAMATIPNPLLLCASSPYAKRGELHNAHKKFYGKDGPVLVWQADSRTMNPSLPQRVIDDAYERDEVSAASEYGRDGVISFRSDIQSFCAPEVVAAATAPGRYELPPSAGIAYAAFVDPSGGSADSMTLAIGHRDRDGNAIIDAVREARPPFSPDAVVAEFAAVLKTYGISTVQGDRYGGEWPRERFVVHGVEYVIADHTKSQLYLAALPLLNAGRVELLDLPRLSAQLCALERRTARSGKDSVDHPPGGHDDIANAVAGVAVAVAGAALAIPALWRREAFGPPAAITRADIIFAVIVAGQRGDAATVFFARSQLGPLVVADVDLAPLSSGVFATAAARLRQIALTCQTTHAAIFAPSALAAEATRLGLPATDIDTLLADTGLALSAATHIGAGRVALAATVHEKAAQLPLGGLLDAGGPADDPLRLACLAGIAAALDTGRRLRSAA